MTAGGERVRGAVAKRIALTGCWIAVVLALLALGTWQVHRLQWKLALIARVEQRVHAPPVPAPDPDRWARITAESDEYRHVRADGVLLMDRTTKVQAVTELGSGYWLLTPLRMADGNIVLVNRGFVPPEASHDAPPVGKPAPERQVPASVTGLLRLTEPGGAFLRNNDPAAGRWYSRDVQAIVAAQNLAHAAPYFIDADADAARTTMPGSVDHPVGGLTVIAFHNNHLAYALTWYALACMAMGAGIWMLRDERKRRAGLPQGHIDPTDGDGSGNDDGTGGKP